ncbi:zinc finger family protein [Scheffersomyces amazonensis]|uniref:zinc finger family protein n=1 Tax=Scheffersomyces amazonensis TaxID=1078765 RepID=UPI00315D80FB
MAISFKWPILGVIVPSILIGMIGYGSHYFVFTSHLNSRDQLWFEFYLSMVWISYIIAIFKQPGSPPHGFQPNQGEWRRWCKKCKNYKPERSHHCKSCKKCVLQMDHHCPWTMNCVGHDNIAHFLRFLLWVIWTTGYVMIQLSKRAIQYYEESNLPAYLINKSEMIAVIFLLPIDFFVFATIVVLFIRCVINFFFKGMTQIEVWESERIEGQIHTERFWNQIKRNYFRLHNKELPRLTSWRNENERTNYDENDEDKDTSSTNNDINENSSVPEEFTFDDLIFPYDLGIWNNIVSNCGSPWKWILPWGGTNSSGYKFEKSGEFIEDDQLGLPWPPDGGHQENGDGGEINRGDIELQNMRRPNYRLLKKRLDPRSTMKRTEWMNDLGETLDDLGVDIDAEDTDNEELIVVGGNSNNDNDNNSAHNTTA